MARLLWLLSRVEILTPLPNIDHESHRRVLVRHVRPALDQRQIARKVRGTVAWPHRLDFAPCAGEDLFGPFWIVRFRRLNARFSRTRVMLLLMRIMITTIEGGVGGIIRMIGFFGDLSRLDRRMPQYRALLRLGGAIRSMIGFGASA